MPIRGIEMAFTDLCNVPYRNRRYRNSPRQILICILFGRRLRRRLGSTSAGSENVKPSSRIVTRMKYCLERFEDTVGIYSSTPRPLIGSRESSRIQTLLEAMKA